jgi:hypothetical protein
MNFITKLFQKPSAKALAQRDLEECRRQLLASHSAAEYHAKQVEYYAQVVKRLSKYVTAEEV